MKFQASQKWRRHGADMALFAMLALWISPAFAWVCCCHEAAPQKTVAAHACCAQAPQAAHVSAPDHCDCDQQQSLITARAETADNFVFAPAILSASTPLEFAAPKSDVAAYGAAQNARPPTPDPFACRGRAPPIFLA